jgi:serine/threonine-protein kinase
MSPELYQRVRKLFDETLERPGAERLSFLDAACGGDKEAFQAVRQLLEAHGEAELFLEEDTGRTQRVGRYVIGPELGRGAMGIVYEAVDPLIDRKIAVKVINFQSFAASKDAIFLREQLFHEARSAGLLSHPGIVIIFDVGQEGDMAFIAMEHVEGPSLQEILASDQEIERSQKFDILRQTAMALDYAHQNSVVHRDVKPANIMLHKGATVKLTDFGIAKITTTQQVTRSGMVAGTPAYMSPEQLRALPVDGRSDQFSLAVIAFEMLTGIRPFRADSLATMVHQVVYENRPSARAANSSLSPAADMVFYRGLSQLPEGRYGTCAEFVAELEAALQEKPSTQSLRATAAQDQEPVSDRAPDMVASLVEFATVQREQRQGGELTEAGSPGVPSVSEHLANRQHDAQGDIIAGAPRPAPAMQLRTRPRLAAALAYLLPSLAITLVLRWYLDTSPVTRDRPLGFAETAVVFMACLMVVAVVRWVRRLLKTW